MNNNYYEKNNYEEFYNDWTDKDNGCRKNRKDDCCKERHMDDCCKNMHMIMIDLHMIIIDLKEDLFADAMKML